MPENTHLLIPQFVLLLAIVTIPPLSYCLGETDDSSALNDNMVFISGGDFLMGSASDDPDRDGSYDELLLRSIGIESFWIDIYEYPNKEGEPPLTMISLEDARKLCLEQGKRLCTEEEWEKACKGPENSKFPYGGEYDPVSCNSGGLHQEPVPSGYLAGCKSGYGVYDMSGNVNEYTDSRVSSSWAGEGFPILRGGDWSLSGRETRCANRDYFYLEYPPETKREKDGFRCCRNADEVAGETEIAE